MDRRPDDRPRADVDDVGGSEEEADAVGEEVEVHQSVVEDERRRDVREPHLRKHSESLQEGDLEWHASRGG